MKNPQYVNVGVALYKKEQINKFLLILKFKAGNNKEYKIKAI